MKFGVLGAVSGFERSFSPEPLRDLFRRLQSAEQQGFESAWLAPGNLWQDDSGYPIPLAAAHFASQSERVRMGLVLPLTSGLHPLRVAEEIAALDVMTDGRVDWAAAYTGDAQDQGNSLSEEAFCEQLSIVKGAWTTDRFDWDGEAYAFSDIGCFPRPVQDPHPPTAVLIEGSSMLAWAAAKGHAVMAGPWSALSDIEAQRRVLSEAGLPAAGAIEKVIRYVHVGTSVARAREEVGAGLLHAYRERFLSLSATFSPNEVRVASPLDETSAVDESSDRLLEFLFENTVVVGDAIYCRDKVAEIRDTLGVDSFLCCQDGMALDSESLQVSQTRWIEDVVPAFC